MIKRVQMQKILLMEDDTVLAETLCVLLKNEGFEVVLAVNGEEALEATYKEDFDLFLFDVNVAYMNGFELLKSLRESADKTPAIFITALTDIGSLSHGFDVGADDYIKKPFDFDELLVRMQALLRKSYKTYEKEIALDDFRFSIEKQELYKSGDFIPLAPMDLKVTKLLFQNLDKTIQKEDLLEYLGEGREMSEASLRVYINKLRKIGLPITTVKGIGYRLGKS